MNNFLKEINIDTKPVFIFIDGSYYNFYRYHSLLTWWKNAFTEDTECIKDPYQNQIFVEKFKKTFSENIKSLKKKITN